MTPPVRTRFVREGGPALAYQVVGDGGRDFFYVAQPHTPIDLMWDDPLHARGLRRLVAEGRLLTCDLRGWGSSDAVDPTDLPALQAWMDDIGRVMDAAGSERAVLIGMSEQALPCVLFAAAHPERIEALVLWAPFVRYLRAPDHPVGMPEQSAKQLASIYGEVTGTGELVDLFAPSRRSEPGFREWFARCERLGLRPANAAPVYASVFQPSDLRDVAPTITAPTLLLRRSGDRHVRTGHAQRLAETMPSARLVELEGDDHLWWAGDSDRPIDELLTFVTGLTGHVATSTRQLSTILFTDIVDSTQQAARLGDAAWVALLGRHDEIIERHIAAYRGVLVKTTGDGVLATFDGPARAVRCACDIRDAVRTLGLSIRGGLHTGEVEVAEDDVHGMAVHVAARVAAHAGADEILVSGAVPPLVLGSRLDFAERGSHALKGVPGSWELFVVTAS